MSLLHGLLNVENDLLNVVPSIREIRINIRMDGAVGSGTPGDPFNGSTDSLLDNLLSEPQIVPANATIRFGPGIFQTKGVNGPDPGFQPLSGQRFIGSGMYQTTLQLVNGRPLVTSGKPGVIGTDLPVRDIEICDMTLDCNLTRQSMDAAGVSFTRWGHT